MFKRIKLKSEELKNRLEQMHLNFICDQSNKLRVKHGVTDLTDFKHRKDFVDIVNDHINFYNNARDNFKQYYENAISSHITTAHVMGWEDIADDIASQFTALCNGCKPQPIRRKANHG